MKKKDFLLIVVLLLIALVSYLGIQKWQGSRTAVLTNPVSKGNQDQTEAQIEAQTEGTTEDGGEVQTEVATEENSESQTEGTEEATEPVVTGHYGIRIYADGEELGVYSLEEDQIIQIGDTNTVEIKGGGASMIDAQCPDQLCRHMGTIYDPYGLIVCLPNGVIVEGVNLSPEPAEVEIDGIS